MPRTIASLIFAVCATGALSLLSLSHIQQQQEEQQATTRQQDSTAEVEEEFTTAQLEFFENKVRPILVEHCYDCHGPDSDPVEGGLSLVSRKSILTGGDSGPAIDLANLSDSYLLSAVQHGDLFQMPPDSKLTDQQIETIRTWVMDRAPWPKQSDVDVARQSEFDLATRKAEHWCWQPIQSPTPPTVNDEEWPIDDLDNFILAKLEQASLKPAAAADRRTWLRRVTFDLTGLPPTRQHIQDFLNDESDEAYPRVVDRLLGSAHYGERWSRHWMDLVRYAETCGHEFDYPIPYAHEYRDYLIRAFNRDVPYNDLLVEHVAGDLLDRPRRHPELQFNESVLGTGYWFLGEATHGPVDVKGDEAGRIDNQIDVFGKTFLGLTIACARCHDHKFDAISAADYYGISGFLQSSRRQNVMLDPGRKIEAQFARANEILDQASQNTHQFLRSLSTDEPSDEMAKHMQAAVLFLQQDPAWQVADRVVLEGEKLKQKNKTAGNARRQNLRGWSKGAHLWWTDAKPDDQLTLEFSVPIAGQYELLARLTKAPDYGIVQLNVNDEVVGDPVDLYSKEVEKADEISLGTFDFTEQTQTLTITITGKNDEAAAGYMAGLDYLALRYQHESTATETAERIEALATEFSAEPGLIKAWVTAIQDPDTTSPQHALYLLRRSAESTVDLRSDAGDDFFHQLHGQLSAQTVAHNRWLDTQSEPFSISPSQWRTTGFAFERDYRQGQVNFVDPDTVWSNEDPRPHSGLMGTRYQGVIRTPTFQITKPHVYYRLAAKNAKIRLIVDGFRMDVNNALLFNGLSFDVDTGGKWQWVHQSGDLKNHIGHRAFIEIIDLGDGFAAIDQIRFADQPMSDQPANKVSAEGSILSEPGAWHDGRFNKGHSPLDLVTRDLAQQFQLSKLISPATGTVQNIPLFNFLLRHKLISKNRDSQKKYVRQLNRLRERWQELDKKTPRPRMAIGMVDGSPENEFLFIRGNHKNLSQPVSRGPITALRDSWSLEQIDELGTSGRRQLADHMISPTHPLTRRVIVNRIWHHLTGQGIVPSVDNFGVLGNQPTHPLFLDYLASQFSEQDWSIKKMIRRIVLSQTYRMSSVSSNSDQDTARDPNNDLLYKFRIRRLPGEAIRDSLLAISGELDPKMFGPGVPIYLTKFMQGRGRPGKSGPLDGAGRRSIYIQVRRNFLSPMMLAFDTPNPFNSIGRRTTSNVPAQALIMLNDPLITDQAGKWAKRLIETLPNDTDKRIQHAFESAIGRLPSETELANLNSFIATQQKTYGDDLSQQQLWTDICHVLFNLKEFIYVK